MRRSDDLGGEASILRHPAHVLLVTSARGGDSAGEGAVSGKLLANARQDAVLVTELLATPRDRRLRMVRQQSRFHRPTLLTLLNLQAESALLQPGSDANGLALAELAGDLAIPLTDSPAGARHLDAAALAYWLLGKHRLQAADILGAEAAFLTMISFLPSLLPTDERALTLCGMAQLHQHAGRSHPATGLYQQAAVVWKQQGASGAPIAACLAEIGFLLLDEEEVLLAHQHLKRAYAYLDPALAPTLAVRIAYACAEWHAMAHPDAPNDWLAKARRLAHLPAAPAEDIRRTWSEGRVAARAGNLDRADALLDRARQALLAHGSLPEAIHSTFDHLLLRAVALGQAETIPLTRALTDTFGPPALPWADALGILAAATVDPDFLSTILANFLACLRRNGPQDPNRPDLLVPTRTLTDRLLRRRGEHEDPLGAARC